MSREGGMRTQHPHDATGRKEEDLVQLYNQFFTPPQHQDNDSPFKVVSMFDETDQVVVTDYTADIEENRLAELE